MGGDGNEEGRQPSEQPSGKGKARERIGDQGAAGSAGSLLSNVMGTARSSVNASNLASIVSASGKPQAGLPSSSATASRHFEETHRAAAGQGGAQGRRYDSGTFHQSDASLQGHHDEAYRQFTEAGPPRIGMDSVAASSLYAQPSSPAYVGPYSSAQALDAPFHNQVRTTSAAWNEFDEAWRIASTTIPEEEMGKLQDPVYHEAWARNIPAPMFAGQGVDMQQGQHIDELLQSVSLADLPAQSNARNVPTDIMGLLEEEEQREGPSNAAAPIGDVPSAHLEMSEEQSEMHRALDALQMSEERANERIRPPNDDEAARTGVYAATPAEALQAIWDGSTEGERASSFIRGSQDNVARRIREILKRGSYVDDVYGIPPQLEKTIVEAEQEETEENRERRAKAIRRLDALYRHLGSGTPATSIDDFVKGW